MTQQHTVMSATLALLLLGAGGCMSGPGFLKQDTSATKIVDTQTDSNGVTSASLDGSSDVTQVVKAGEVELSFPPGSVGISTQVGIEPGIDLASESFAAEAGVDAGAVTAGGQAVVISGSNDVMTAQPFTVALALPEGSALRLAGGSCSVHSRTSAPARSGTG